MYEFFCFLGQGQISRPAPPGWEGIHYGQSPRCLLPELGMEVAHIHTFSESYFHLTLFDPIIE